MLQMREIAQDAINPHLFTVATLTGHAWLTVGDGYSIGKLISRGGCPLAIKRLFS